MRRPLPKISEQSLLAVSFRTQLQNLLLPHQIHGQRARHHEGEILWLLALEISWVVLEQKRVTNFVKLHELSLHARVHWSFAVVQKIHLPFQELVACISVEIEQFHDAKG